MIDFLLVSTFVVTFNVVVLCAINVTKTMVVDKTIRDMRADANTIVQLARQQSK